MENRVTRLEAIVETLQSDISDIKIDLRAFRTEVREDNKRLDDKIDCIQETIHSTRLWAIWLYMGLAAGLFSTMAGGFMWMVSELRP